MHRRAFVTLAAAYAATPAFAQTAPTPPTKLVIAARAQIGVTTTYDPRYVTLAYPNGDLPRSTGVCADVIVRAYRDALGLDLQKLLHEDMLAHFSAYPRIPGMRHADANIDQRRVLNLQAYWRRQQAELWSQNAAARPGHALAGDAFPAPVLPGDCVTWLISASLPHIGIISSVTPAQTLVVHNIGRGAEETDLAAFHAHPAAGHYRWFCAI